jgi:hypothetical protein
MINIHIVIAEGELIFQIIVFLGYATCFSSVEVELIKWAKRSQW